VTSNDKCSSASIVTGFLPQDYGRRSISNMTPCSLAETGQGFWMNVFK